MLPGFWLFSTVSEVTGTDERDLDGDQDAAGACGGGRVLASGRKSSRGQIEPRVYSVFGGFHLVDVTDAEVSSIVTRFRDKGKFERVAAGHCTGEFAFSEFNRVFGGKFDRAGVAR